MHIGILNPFQSVGSLAAINTKECKEGGGGGGATDTQALLGLGKYNQFSFPPLKGQCHENSTTYNHMFW